MPARTLAILLLFLPPQTARAQTAPRPPTTVKGALMNESGKTEKETTEQQKTGHATGPFDIKMAPLPLADPAADPTLSRLSLDKHFHGDLEATSKGEMLSAGTPAKGFAGYVAIEHVTATLHSQAGSFSLQHSGTLSNGTPQLAVTVVPGSGTGRLTGLTGSMTITNTAGKHTYAFTYQLPAQ